MKYETAGDPMTGLLWTRKEKGKTITKTLNQNQIQMLKKAFKNMKEFDQLVEKWKMLSLLLLEKIKPRKDESFSVNICG